MTMPNQLTPRPGNFTYRHIMRVIDGWLPDDNPQTVMWALDVGCGTGRLSHYIASNRWYVLGIDKDISKTTYGYGSTYFCPCDIESLCTTIRFSFILCTEVLEHIPNDGAALRKMCDLLEPGGILVLTVPLEQAPLHRLRMRLTGHDSFDERVGHLRRYSIHDLCMDMLPPELHICEMYGNEGPLRNWLFTTRSGHWLLRGIRGPIADVVTAIDNVLGKLFGTAQLILVAQKQGIR